MKKKIFLFILFITLGVNAQSNFYEVVLEADLTYANSSAWLNQAVSWGATGINLRLLWKDFGQGSTKWSELSSALTLIRSKTSERGNPLDVYIRISLNRFPSQISGGITLSDDDYQKRFNGQLYTYPYAGGGPMLNYSTTNSRNAMGNFVTEVVTHLSTYGVPIKAIFAVLSADDESEYTWHYLQETGESSGYSTAEISKFRLFLQNKYGNLTSLNNKWLSSFDQNSGFDVINIQTYNWHSITWDTDINNTSQILYPSGRKDWLDFKVQELGTLLLDFASRIHYGGFLFGLQFPPFYTNTSEYSGRYDPTPLLNNVDIFIEDDTPHGRPNFEFNSNLMRSLAKYWSVHNTSKNLYSNPVKFGTETNWFGSISGISESTLSNYWSDQARISKNYGGSVLFISHWGTTEFPQTAQNFLDGVYNSSYSIWRTTLQSINDENTIPVDALSFSPGNRMAHISFAQGLYRKAGVNYPHRFNYGIPDPSGSYGDLYPLAEFYFANDSYKSNSIYGGNKMFSADVLTDYMCENKSMNMSPNDYLAWHGGIFFTAASYYISDAAYNVLSTSSNYKDNGTYYNNVFYVSVLSKNEYNQTRSSRFLQKNNTGEYVKTKVPITFNLEQNYPNPFNPSTDIKYSIPSKDIVTLKVFDSLGREVSSLVNEMKEPGNYSVTFDGSKLSSGVYIYKLSSSTQQISKKLLLIK